MSNRNANKVNKDLETEGRRVGSQFDQYTQRREGLADEARGRSDAAYGSTMSGYQDLINRLKDPAAGARGDSSRRYYKDFAETGGLDDENKQRIRGMGVFDEFAKTGGWNEGQKANLRDRLTRGVASQYGNLRDELTRANASTGGSNPSFDASTSAMARQQFQQGQEALTDAETEIMDRVNQGRMWGSSSMSDAERALVDALQRGKMFGAEGMSREDDADWRAGAANREMELGALGGMAGLRGQTPGEVNMYEGAVAGGLQGGADARRGILNDRMAYNPNRSFAERISPYFNMAAGAAGSFFGGGGAPRNTGITGGMYRPGMGYYQGAEQNAPWWGS